MVCRRGQLGWLLVAWATLVAQAAPPACCGACDEVCCAVPADRCGPAAAETNGAAATNCPLCAATPTAPETDSDSRPCRCCLDAAHEQPFVPSQSPLRNLSADGGSVLPATASLDVPPALGASREYLAASLAVPIRPARILFGVWRN